MPHRRSKEASARRKRRKNLKSSEKMAFSAESSTTAGFPEAPLSPRGSGVVCDIRSPASEVVAAQSAHPWSRERKRRRHRNASPQPGSSHQTALFTECWVDGHCHGSPTMVVEEPFGSNAEAETVELLAKRARLVREYLEETLTLCASKTTNSDWREPVVEEAASREAEDAASREPSSKRRSGRRTAALLEAERANHFEAAIEAIDESCVRVVESASKGRGVVAARRFERADMVLEYRGELITRAEARARERRYAADSSVGCYMYYFELASRQYCVDATAETSFVGRLVNHSAKRPNLLTKAVRVKQQPRLILVAARAIAAGEELLYDYGERNKDAVASHPWLRDS